ncbi:protein of unknown function [Taphrina deformans PYCC 5710]|uniref:ER-bound oxygenase mpaB/mpaB'/Rubber oxygenase catalytic domain-containing protein n=1 Tax=Taphrina deformans (strain PYCC 5710 / ATCC 11124 / CBS 356.35 / IMI 108563 / JCM 9778 / NBRC 8474) TaxID=1097556 RepID=R4XDT9_TAPDE|nr:protein of unknown function [Taphrina deformans PYCC 5710]|eukprot:CCG84036.1 protein of unknown function [Taphrina deformans PYCC 5710]
MRYHVRSEEEAKRLAPQVGDYVRLWNIEFRWTELHQNPSQLASMRHSVDQLADAAFRELALVPKQAAYEALEAAIDSKDVARYPNCHKLWHQVHTVPEWVDFEQIRRGQDVFFRYAGAAFTGLLNDSLLGGFGARRISEVLVRTGSFGVESARRRLLQTTQWILDVMDNPDAVRVGAKGWKNTISVCEEKPDFYDIEENGLPINDLHSLVTLTSFSSTLIDHTFPAMYVYLTKRQRDDYIALWRWLAYLIGTDDKYFVDADMARACLESITLAELWPDQDEESHTRTLLHNSISAIANQPPSRMSYDYICAQVRWLHGDEYSDALGIPQVTYYARFITAAKVSFFLVMSGLGYIVPGLDKRRIERIRPILYNMVVTSKEVGLGNPVGFEMEWAPTVESLVRRAAPLTREQEKSVSLGMEKHYFTALFFVLSGVVGTSYVGVLGLQTIYRHLALQ